MSYLGAAGEHSAVVRATTEPTVLDPGAGTVAAFVAPGSVTQGEFGLFRWDMGARRAGPGRHFHRGFSESFYVLSGVVTFDDGERELDLEQGGFLYVPRGGIHGFRNRCDAPASMLILFAPGVARERYFEELADIRWSGRTLTPEEWADLFARHDQVNL